MLRPRAAKRPQQHRGSEPPLAHRSHSLDVPRLSSSPLLQLKRSTLVSNSHLANERIPRGTSAGVPCRREPPRLPSHLVGVGDTGLNGSDVSTRPSATPAGAAGILVRRI